MAEPVGFKGSNMVYRAPDGFSIDECVDLPVYADAGLVISCWRLTSQELAEVAETGVVWVRILGREVSPFYVTGIADLLVDGEPSKAEPFMPRAPKRVEDKP